MKPLTIFLTLAVVAVAAACWCCGCQDSIKDEFGWLIDDAYFQARAVLQQKEVDWYRVYALSDECARWILESAPPRLQRDYEGWRRVERTRRCLGVKAILVVDGEAGEVFVNRKKGSDDSDGVEMYLNRSENLLILHDHKTYGR